MDRSICVPIARIALNCSFFLIIKPRSKDGSLPKPHWAKTYKAWLPDIDDIVKLTYKDAIKKAIPILKEFHGKGPGGGGGPGLRGEFYVFQKDWPNSLFPLD